MITKIAPDKQKSDALKIMAEITLERLKGTELTKYPSNTLNDYYDVIHKLMEAITIKAGLKFRGEGAHQELIDYVSKMYDLGEPMRVFLQEMRDYRNRVAYEGFMVSKNYVIVHEEKIKEIIVTLQRLCSA